MEKIMKNKSEKNENEKRKKEKMVIKEKHNNID